MSAEKNRVMKYKPMLGQLHEHFGFKLLADGNIKTAGKVYCIYCDKSFMDLTHRLLITFKTNTCYSIRNSACKRIKPMESDSDLGEGVENAFDEVQQYIMEKKVAESVDPLQWCKLNGHQNPKLALFAKTVLCIAAAFVPCE
ncbi:zinc finger BED domain-containing 1-like [Octopus vulgaris]|uniref:Zinc finger BED domain-containing 1-like n=1 Tax=Octopus vulgaris TaxID=6645 RepID=A0AA36B6Z2_OCTVU|nr:zinc finger BED domain-containing 1-like [Octopus vulgaris]